MGHIDLLCSRLPRWILVQQVGLIEEIEYRWWDHGFLTCNRIAYGEAAAGGVDEYGTFCCAREWFEGQEV